ncbi:hypothetical protein [Halomonas sp. DN3]|uniref:hypothetical protein n=1 Tax=Halomonas sp. DN3 TaxID=2953657 RepID=UPI0020A052FB|nr:hypothetical protein [Halomonas sp. DN3]USZ51570.1 hypothetical protein NKF27_08775 [Halomonas sp. DN3]
MSFIKTLYYSLFRYFKDVKFISKTYGWSFSIAVFCLFTSEVLKVVSFIIPLKIILLLSADHIPQSLAPYMVFGTLHQWVIILSFMTVFTYLLSIFFLYCSKVAVRKGGQTVRGVRQKDEKTWSSAKTRDVVVHYKMFSESLSDFILSAICFSALVFVNIKVSTFIVVLVFLIVGVFSWMYRNLYLRRVVFGLKYKFLVEYTCQGTFFAIFLFMIFDYLLWSPINPILAMITLIVSRRMMSASDRFIKKLVRLQVVEKKAVTALMLERDPT